VLCYIVPPKLCNWFFAISRARALHIDIKNIGCVYEMERVYSVGVISSFAQLVLCGAIRQPECTQEETFWLHSWAVHRVHILLEMKQG
jgi:hypothetical protein